MIQIEYYPGPLGNTAEEQQGEKWANFLIRELNNTIGVWGVTSYYDEFGLAVKWIQY